MNPAGERTPPAPAEPAPPRAAGSGQVIIMFALLATAMFGLLGLAIDLGMAFAERRTMQNAADLGAIAGARAIARYTSSAPTSALTDVTAVVGGNRMENAPFIEECVYLDAAGSDLGACSATVPAAAVSVRVEVSEVHSTYFIRVVPGGPDSLTTGAVAVAGVERLFRAGMDGPFIVCGYSTYLASGGTMDILLDNNTVNPAAIGQTFEVHGPHVADCGLASSSWKGLAENRPNAPTNDGRELNEYWYARTGDSAGPTRFEVEGIEGCATGASGDFDCVLLLPVASNAANGFAPIKTASTRQFYVPKVLAFRVTQCGSNCHQGVLLDDYLSFGGSVDGWTRDGGGVAVIKLQS